MSEKLGLRKVVRGETTVDDFFVKVTPFGKDTIWINREAVVVIREIGDS